MQKPKKEEEEEKKGGPPPSETILEKRPRDPDEAVLAEQAIHRYAEEVLAVFRDAVDNAMTNFESFLSAQEATATHDRAFLEELGAEFLQMMVHLFGGKNTPIAQAALDALDGVIDQAARQPDPIIFCNLLARGTRDLTWFLRDNLQSVLSNQWDELRDLAYEGSTDFVGLLHALGMPSERCSAKDISDPLTHAAHQFLKTIPKKKEEVLEQGDLKKLADTEEKEQEKEPAQLALEEEEEKKAAV
jgi:hypothetical protein